MTIEQDIVIMTLCNDSELLTLVLSFIVSDRFKWQERSEDTHGNLIEFKYLKYALNSTS